MAPRSTPRTQDPRILDPSLDAACAERERVAKEAREREEQRRAAMAEEEAQAGNVVEEVAEEDDIMGDGDDDDEEEDGDVEEMELDED